MSIIAILIGDDMLPNLQILLSDQKGVHKASAHLWIEGLLQTTEQLKVLFSIGSRQFLYFLLVSKPFTDPWEHVIDLLKKDININIKSGT